MAKQLNSNSFHSEIEQVCRECGIAANVMTCLYKYGEPPKQLAFTMSTYHTGKCDWCKETKPVTEVRDFFYPNFALLMKAREMYKRKQK